MDGFAKQFKHNFGHFRNLHRINTTASHLNMIFSIATVWIIDYLVHFCFNPSYHKLFNMRFIKILFAVLVIPFVLSCDSKSDVTPSLAGNWKITSALGNDGRHWVGAFTLTQEGNQYKGIFNWATVDGQATGIDSVEGSYNQATKVLTLRSVLISGNIESVVYTINVLGNGRAIKGIWTGSSDGSIENPGVWTAVRQ
jgi:hypothetical protein